MLYITIGLFAIAAVLGIIITAVIFRNQPTPKPAVYAHGAFAAAGLVLLIIKTLDHPHHLVPIALGVLGVAALGGFVLFGRDIIKKKPGPFGLIIVHAMLAFVGVIILLLSIMP
jgi:hypothetical protein